MPPFRFRVKFIVLSAVYCYLPINYNSPISFIIPRTPGGVAILGFKRLIRVNKRGFYITQLQLCDIEVDFVLYENKP